MSTEYAERVLKAANRVTELRAERARLTTEIDAKIRQAEMEFESLLGGGPITGTPTLNAALDTGLEAGTRQESIIRALGGEPGISYGDLAMAVYGEDTPKTRHRLRATLYTLRQKGLIRKNRRGELEVIYDALALK